MEHPAFADAGAEAGIQIWTIDKFEPVAIENKMYGKFYNGDSYIVLKTTGEPSSTLAYDAHFWLGSNTTQDKKGSAAILTITLDDMLGGKAVHHREVQGHESSQFLGYFKPAIRYMEGGNESGFNEVETNAGAEKRLLKLSGTDNMRIEEVAADSSSLTKDHCFILEVDHDIFVLMPDGAKATQRRKIILVANTLRDDYHNGRATIEIIDEFSSDEDIAAFFEALGSGSKDDLASDDSSDTYAREDMTAVYLYRVLVGDELDVVALSKPYEQRQLSSDEVYILDTPCSGVYVWLGADVDAEVKKKYHEIAQQYLDVKGYPAWVHVTRVAEGAECCTFKQYFHSWKPIRHPEMVAFSAILEDDYNYFAVDPEEANHAAKFIGKSATARGYMPDEGDGSLTVFRLAGEQEDVTEKFQSETCVLYQSETYVLKYQYSNEDGEDSYVIYWWIGADANDDDKKAALELVGQLEDEVEGNLTIVKIPQGKENKHFLKIFKGNLVVLLGSKDNEYKTENYKKTYDDDHIRLFRVGGTELGVDMRAVQVEESADVLDDHDVFVLEHEGGLIVRNGKEADMKVQMAALEFVKSLVPEDTEITEVEQGEEPEEFWNALGGKPEEEEEERSDWYSTVNRRVNAPRILTAVTVTIAGKIKFEELPLGFTQEDLSDDGVYILDGGEELYVWQGKNIPERVRIARPNIIKEYIEDDGLDRTVDSAIVINVKQNQEPKIFKKHFPSWDNEMWDNQTSYEDMKSETKAANSK